MKISLILIFASFLGLSISLFNPGALVTIPFPLKPPTINLNLPIKIQPIIVNALQLSNINLKQINYSWQFTQQNATVKITDAKILFQWSYKGDKGEGTFTQTLYELDLNYTVTSNNNKRLAIDIPSTKSKLGHSSVHLGGNVKQSVVIQVTNLIMNHAAVTFRKTIQNAISSGIKSFASILDTDIKIMCPKQVQNILEIFNNVEKLEKKTKVTQKQTQKQLEIESQKCLFINTTLVAPPIVNNKTLIIQINGSPYLTGQASGELNPDSILVKSNNPNIQLQVHAKLIQQTLKKALTVTSQSFEFWVNQISTTPDLNSLTFSPIFPKMTQFPQIRDVLLSFIIPAINSTLNQATQQITLSGSTILTVSTKSKSMKSPEKYMKQCNVTFTASLQIIYGWKSTSGRLSKLNITSVQCDYSDIDQGYVKLDQYYSISNPLLTFLRTGINGSLNRKLIGLNFNGIQAILSGNIQSQFLKFGLTLTSGIQSFQQHQKIKIILQD